MANVLFVCTANICRSPSAELLARAMFGEQRNLFRSAGFMTEGRTCPPKLVNVLSDRGIDARSHQSSVVDIATLDNADLVLTMESRHLQQATVVAPEALYKIVPLTEAAEIVRPGDSVGSLLERLNVDRQPDRYLSTAFDVDDPYGGSRRAYRRAVTEIDSLVRRLFGALDA